MRRIALATALLAILVVAAPAQAYDFCVVEQRGACSGATSSLQSALYAAAGSPGFDRVLIGHGDYVAPDGGYVYDSPDPVEIRGISATDTRVLQASPTTSAQNAFRVSNTSTGESTVADLGIVVGDPPFSTLDRNTGLEIGKNGRVEDVSVRAAPGAGDVKGIEAAGDTTITGVDIDFGGSTGQSVGVHAGGAGGVVTIEDSSLHAWQGFYASLEASAYLRRVDVTSAFQCVGAFSASVNADNVVCHLEGRLGGSSGFAAGPGGSFDAELIVRNATITGGDAESYGAYAAATSGGGGTVRLLDSIVWVPGHGVGRSATAAPEANVLAERNDFHPAATPGDNSGPGTLVNAGARTDDPRFLGDPVLGELRLRHDSPLIDAGNESPPLGMPDDHAGDERVRDGDGDGDARIDLGAFEYQRTAPETPAVSATPATATTGSPFAFAASATDPDGDPLTYRWSFDDGGAADGPNVSRAFAALGTHTGTATVTDATGLTASGSASVQATQPAAQASAPPSNPAGPPPTTSLPAAGPPDTVAPRFSILRRGLRLSRTGTIPVRVTCSATEREPCAGTITLASAKKVGPRKRILQLGRAAFSVAPDRTAIVRVRVSTANARFARRLRKIKVIAVGTARDSAGNTATAQRTATLITAKPERTRKRR